MTLDARSARFWLLLAAVPFGLLAFSHFVFVKWLYMRPCPECVYIRFAFFVAGLSFLVCALLSQNKARILSSLVSLCSIGYGIAHAFSLLGKTNAGSCSISTEPFSLYGLEKVFPTLFRPTGECGFTAPLVPFDAKLGSIQRWFINLYSDADGWYLIPSAHFGSMATLSIVLLVTLGAVVAFVEYKDFSKSTQRKE